MKIKHYIKEVKPSIFAVVIKDKYDRAMLFCRAQEYYECPSPKFRGKEFSIWDYMKWYHERYGRGFSYGDDWSGFNIPLRQINDCYNKLNKTESPYDHLMYKILSVLNLKYIAPNNSYVIGCGDTKGDTFKHEVCHGLYYTDKEYKKKMDALTKGLPKKYYDTFKKNILEMGYTTKVVDDEIQAYLQYGYDNPDFGRGVDIGVRIEYSNLYQQQAKL
jgi:hypothetical protein